MAVASSPSDEEKLVRQLGGEKPLRVETLSMGMDGLRRYIASGIDGFEYFRRPLREGAQPRVWKTVGWVDKVQRMIVRLPLRQQFDQRSALEVRSCEEAEALADPQS